MEESLHLFSEHHRGSLWAYIDDFERTEQRKRPLTPDEKDLASLLIRIGEQPDQQRQALRDVGIEKALPVLREILARPGIPFGGRRLYPYIERQAGDVRWLLEEIEIAITGIHVRTAIWFPLLAVAPLPNQRTSVRPTLLSKDAIKWSGFVTLEDDVGTHYHSHGLGCSISPMISVSTPLGSTANVFRQHMQRWHPGPPVEATHLILTGSPYITIQRPLEPDPPRPEHDILLEDLTLTVTLPEPRSYCRESKSDED